MESQLFICHTLPHSWPDPRQDKTSPMHDYVATF